MERNLGARLRELRRAAELTQEQLAERAGLSPRTVSDIERGLKQTPQPATLELLISALNLDEQQRKQVLASVPRRRHAGPPAKDHRAFSHLPSELTILVGRERDEASAVHIIETSGVRLLTLTGPGGVGKTRLAMRVARTLQPNYADGARFISLAPFSHAQDMASYIAMTLGIRDEGGSPPQEVLTSWLQSRNVLLILDNFEHVADLAPIVTELLEACPRLTVLATSRQPLHLRGEHLFEVPPLVSPGPGSKPSVSEALTCSAISLFVQRAQAVQPRFQLTPDLVDPVSEICRRLDALPLAIELAAAQVRFTPPAQILDGMGAGVGAFGGGPVDAPQRHRNLRDTVSWSYGLLTASEQRMFRVTSVFVDGFSADAATLIGREIDAAETVNRLAEKSLLVTRETKNGVRFGVLETIRAFASQEAEFKDEQTTLRQSHADYFLSMANEAGVEQRRSGTATWSDRLREEHENLLAALDWLSRSGRLVDALALAASMTEYWIFWGNVRLAKSQLDPLLERAQRQPEIVPPMAWVRAARLAWLQNEYERASELYLKGLAAHQAVGDVREASVALNNLGTVAHLQNDYEQADGYYERAAAAAAEANYPYGVAMPVTNRGIIAMQRGEYERAADLLDQGIALWREIGNTRMLAVSIGNRASLSFRLNRYDEAASLHEEALDMKRDQGDRISVAHSAGDLGWTEIERGNATRAVELLSEALTIFDEAGHQDGVAECFEAFARLKLDAGEFEDAARLYGCADALRETIGVAHHPADTVRFETAIARLRGSAGEALVDAAWASGRSTSPRELIAALRASAGAAVS